SSERVIHYLEQPRTSANGVTPSIDSSANPNPYAAAAVDGLLSEEALEKSMELTPPSSQTSTAAASAPASTHSSSNPPSSLKIPYFHRSPINMDMSAPIPLPASHGCILNAYGEPIPLVASPTDAIVCSHELLPIGMSITFEPVGLTKSLTQFYNKMKKQCTLDDMANTWCPHVKEYERVRFHVLWKIRRHLLLPLQLAVPHLTPNTTPKPITIIMSNMYWTVNLNVRVRLYWMVSLEAQRIPLIRCLL